MAKDFETYGKEFGDVEEAKKYINGLMDKNQWTMYISVINSKIIVISSPKY